ncbi:IS3 family transposase [Streptomyces sp. NPDC058683]|uniref:IS3 family transposase n=1 Tax=Streptomyces sp. NPDC058683 TaxID=3346597 RepID=UPI003647395A
MAVADPAQVVGGISDFRAVHNIPHCVPCRALDVSESWFYKHRTPKPTTRQTRHLPPGQAVREEFTDSGGTYGSPKIWITLVRKGWRASVNTIAKVMAELRLAGRAVRGRRGLTRPGKRPANPDFVRHDFTAEATDLVWCGDMTEINTGEGKLYLATVIDPVLPPPARICDGRPPRRRPGHGRPAHARHDPRRGHAGRHLS